MRRSRDGLGSAPAAAGGAAATGGNVHNNNAKIEDVATRGADALPLLGELPLPPAKQLILSKGDVVIAHYQLGHTVAPNTSHTTRKMVFFRVFALPHPPGTYRPAALTNIWLDWQVSFEKSKL